MTKKKGQKDKQRSTKHTTKTKNRVTRTPIKKSKATQDTTLIVKVNQSNLRRRKNQGQLGN